MNLDKKMFNKQDVSSNEQTDISKKKIDLLEFPQGKSEAIY